MGEQPRPQQDLVVEAKRRLGLMHVRLCAILQIHETRRILSFTDKIAGQIPTSFAAHAFNHLQQTIAVSLLQTLCTLWDKSNRNQNEGAIEAEISLPTIADWVRSESIRNAILGEHRRAWSKPAAIEPIDPEWRDLFARQAQESAEEKVRDAGCLLNKTIARIESVKKSELLERVQNHRDKFVAHFLTTTRREKKWEKEKGQIFPAAKNRHVSDLLSVTLKLHADLELVVSGASYDWRHQREHAKRCAVAFWNGVTVSVLE